MIDLELHIQGKRNDKKKKKYTKPPLAKKKKNTKPQVAIGQALLLVIGLIYESMINAQLNHAFCLFPRQSNQKYDKLLLLRDLREGDLVDY